MPFAIRPFSTLQRLRAWTVFGALLAALCGASAHAQRMDWEGLTQLAQTRAQEPLRANSDKLPAELARITYDQLRDIRFKTDQSVWRDLNLPFEAQFFHLGLYQTEPVRIHEITPEGTVRHLAYRGADFDYGKNTFDPAPWGDLGHAGFRLHYPLNGQAYKDELVVFQGASYFRALGAGQQYGLSARGLAIDTVGGAGETEVTVLALLESPRATGAYRFVVRPGPQTTTTVTARVFLRAGAGPVNTLGIAPLTSMFLSGENQALPGDFRPEVHDSDGLMMVSGDGEWLWRPLQRPKAVTVSSFAMQNPRGFGLMQRDRGFASYEDVEARYERRPSAWIKPLGDWGPGRVELVQLPAPDETHDNIVAYWVPTRLPAPGQPLEVSYELAWQGDAQQRPPSSWVTQSRRGYGFTKLSPADQARQPQYVLDFTGPALDALPAGAPVKAVVTANANGRVLETLAYPNPATRTWRVTLRVERLDATQPVELRAFLQHHNDTVSETWTHLLLPE
jgi:glucans biosynthesis protein